MTSANRTGGQRDRVTVFAPATVANLGPGFDVLGVAVDGLGDTVVAERLDGPPGVELGTLTGDDGRLPRSVDKNTATVAAESVARRLGIRARIHLEKGLPLSSGLGSSAASSVAGAAAVAALAGVDLTQSRHELLVDSLAGERVASGAAHADNAAPSLLGGAILVHRPDCSPPRFTPLPIPGQLWIALAIPKLELETRRARAALPSRIELGQAVHAWARLGGLITSFFTGDMSLLADSLLDDIVEPVRGALIPGFDVVKAAALEAGALACSISGAGPTVFALTSGQSTARSVADEMVRAWAREEVQARGHACRPDTRGVREKE